MRVRLCCARNYEIEYYISYIKVHEELFPVQHMSHATITMRKQNVTVVSDWLHILSVFIDSQSTIYVSFLNSQLWVPL